MISFIEVPQVLSGIKLSEIKHSESKYFTSLYKFLLLSLKHKSCRLHFITVSEDLALGHLVKVMSVSVPMSSFPSVQGEMQANSLSISSPSQNASQFVFLWPIWSSGLLTLCINFSFRSCLYYGAWHCIFHSPVSNPLWKELILQNGFDTTPWPLGAEWTCTGIRAGTKSCPGQRGMKGLHSSFGFI